MPSFRIVVAAFLVLGPVALAQIQVDDRPKVLEDTTPITKEELNRRKAAQLLRDAQAQFGVGIFRQRHETLIEAATILEKALALDPDSLEIRRTLIPLYSTIGRDDGAITLCKHVIDRDPFDLETAFQYARLLRADGRPTEAVPILQKAAGGKDAQARPERLLFLLSDLFDLTEKSGDYAAAAKAQDAIIRTITEKREQLLYGNGFTRDELQASLARAYEGLGRACVKTKEYDRAVTAFRSARDTLLKCDDHEARHQAVRINWNLSELAAGQGRWAEALETLDAYLEHSPGELEPYEKKLELLHKLGRDRDIVPALRKYAAREEFHLGLQLLLARELTKNAATRGEAETMYRALATKNTKPEIYRGLFRLFVADGRTERVLDQFDEVMQIVRADEGKVKAVDREVAQERARAMLTVFRTDAELVVALLNDVQAELGRDNERQADTWVLLANLAARHRKLDTAEAAFHRCLRNLPPTHEASVYVGLIQIQMRQRKFADVVALCDQALNGPQKARNTNPVVFESSMAGALAEQGKFDAAIAHADKAIKFSNDDGKVRERCHKAQILASAGKFGEAVLECEQTLHEFTNAASVQAVRYALSNVYSLQGDHAKSEEQLRLILEVDPDAPLANNNLGYQMADRNINLDEAERLIRRAIDVERSMRKVTEDDGENAAYLDSLGWVLFRKGKLTEAREWLDKAAALPDGADDPAVWDHLGDVLAKLDQTAKAKEAWKTALTLYDAGIRRKSDDRRVQVEKKLKTVE
ncbi:MAG TPA: tetratricopeptide repeat protein [Gemmataceae bacterium]|nr:tetratricopeptide repeat protein [Gemmataceae bacterium]